MMHKPIQIKNLSLSFPHKCCFENFAIDIHFGSRIAIIGRNGIGKSTLMGMIRGSIEPTSGYIICHSELRFGYVPQVINEFDSLSGGQRLNEALTRALSQQPNILLLDEPTNHLDKKNRKSLMRMLKSYYGTVIIITHDIDLLQNCIDTLWHIDNGKINVFSGCYDDYIRQTRVQRDSINKELSQLNRQRDTLHQSLMKEQKRAAKSRAKGIQNIENRKWPTIVSKAKALRAAETTESKKSAINYRKQVLTKQLCELSLPEVITPRFSITHASSGEKTLLSISEGSVGYDSEKPILHDISLSLLTKSRIALQGDNASGKSTLIKAVLNVSNIIKSGNWLLPKLSDIGYLDQHYATLSPDKTVLDTISECVPTWPRDQVRSYLNDFLFRNNNEVNTNVKQLSGGEKARLCLAQLGAVTPKMLILDELTNNLDLETRNHVIEVLKKYPGALFIVSHDNNFLNEINISKIYQTSEGRIF